jgi:hypothetical protein
MAGCYANMLIPLGILGKADSDVAVQEVCSNPQRKLEFHQRVHKSPATVHNFSQFNPFHILTPYFSENHFEPSEPMFPKFSSTFFDSYMLRVAPPFHRNRDSSVGIEAGWTGGVRFPTGASLFSFPQRPDRL